MTKIQTFNEMQNKAIALFYTFRNVLKFVQSLNYILMKKGYIVLFVFCFYSTLHAQKIGEEILTYQKVTLFHNDEEDHLNMIYSSLQKVKTQNLKKNTFYEKITFEHFGQQLYVSAKYKEMKFGRPVFTKISIPKYVENNQPFCEEPLNEDGNATSDVTLFHSNGKVWKRNEIMNDFGSIAEVVYHFDGTIKRIHPDNYGNTKIKSDRDGTVHRSNWCSDKNLVAHLYKQKNGDTYLGYPIVGTIITKTGYSLTGFTITLEQKYGNGGVFFLENLSTHETYWATILGGHITALSPALLSEKPNIHQLQYEIDVQEDKWSATNISKPLKEKMQLTEKSSLEKDMWVSEDILNVVSKNSTNLTGYGISLVTRNNISIDDHVEIKVGLFKNGVLDVIGQQTRIDYQYVHVYRENRAEKLNAKWQIESGIFNNGNYIKGRKIYIPEYVYVAYDIASPHLYDGFYYKKNQRNPKLSNVMMKLEEVDKMYTAYLPLLERTVTIHSIDLQKGTVTLLTDNPTINATLEVNNEPFYAWKRTATPYRETCNKIIKKPVYREEDVLLYTTYGGVKTNSYTVKGVYYDKVVTTRITTPGTPVYGKKSVVDHYTEEECYKCHGLGYVDKVATDGYYCQVQFEQPAKKEPGTVLFDKISTSLKEKFTDDTKKTSTPEKPVVSVFSASTQTFITTYDTNKNELKKMFVDLVLKYKNEGKTTEQISNEFVNMYTELYANNKKEYAFHIMMKIPDDYLSLTNSKLTPEQREYTKTKAREYIKNQTGN